MAVGVQESQIQPMTAPLPHTTVTVLPWLVNKADKKNDHWVKFSIGKALKDSF